MLKKLISSALPNNSGEFNMKRIQKIALSGLSFGLLLCADFNPQSTQMFGFMPEASAIIGRPATPMSYAGAARRGVGVAHVGVGVAGAAVATTAVVATTATVVAVNENEAAQANAQAQANANAAAQANASAGVLEVGTVVSALPAGCNATKVVNGSSYNFCGGVYYKAGYESGNLVYVVSVP
jgi:hypothetical protein